MDSKNLPSSLVTKIKKIIKDFNPQKQPLKIASRGAADHYNYKFIFGEGKTERKIECTQYYLHNDLRSLLKHIDKRFTYDK